MNKFLRSNKTWIFAAIGLILIFSVVMGYRYINKAHQPVSKTIEDTPTSQPGKGTTNPEQNDEKVMMYLGAEQAVVNVISNIDTMERVEIIRGTEVKRVGDILEFEKRVEEPINTNSKSEEDSLSEELLNEENQNTDIEENNDNKTFKTYILKCYKIEYKNENNEIKVGYVEPEFLVKTKEEVVMEKVAFVRTPTHVYSADKKYLVELADKGSKLDILGYDDFDNITGTVKWYKVKLADGGKEGFIRAKYVINNEKDAMLVYNKNNIMEIHSKRGNVYNAGAAEDLDFFPRKKGKFENNKMPDEVNALYINSGAIKNADRYIEVAKGTRINAFVVDIKDNGTPAYPADAMKTYSPTNYEKAKQYFNTEEEYAEGIKKLKDAGFYLIGRITVFKDEYYVKDHPENAITNTSTNSPYLHNNTYWPSPYVRDVWKFNIELAKESVKKFGFNEIQFDYIRFPDRTLKAEKSGIIDFKNKYQETKSQAVQRFAMYAVDELHDMNVYVSGDVFGESAHQYVTGYGQYWGALSNVLDVISPMAYPDHFSPGNYGFDYPWLYPYKLMNYWSEVAMARQTEIPTPAIIRPWIQSHDAGRTPSKKYGANEISEQLKGYYAAGINNGYMTWWSSSSIEGYMNEREAYKKAYK